jgi:hypothetical protein
MQLTDTDIINVIQRDGPAEQQEQLVFPPSQAKLKQPAIIQAVQPERITEGVRSESSEKARDKASLRPRG